MGRRVSRVLGVAAVAVVAAGCAAGGPSTRTDRVGPAFGELQRVVTFRPAGRDPAGRDVLDGLAESLRARGLAVVEAPPEALPALEALRRRLERWEGPILEERGGAVLGIDEEAGAAARAAGADAVAFAYRFPRGAWPPSEPLPLEPRRAAERPAPLGALVLVSSRDDVVRVTWGAADGEAVLGPASPLEAIDALLGVLPAATPEDRAPAP